MRVAHDIDLIVGPTGDVAIVGARPIGGDQGDRAGIGERAGDAHGVMAEAGSLSVIAPVRKPLYW